MVKRLHAAGHRGHSRRGLQPHRRRQSPGADALLPRRGQRRLLPPRAERPALLHGLHRHGQHAEHDAPARAPAPHGQPALLGHGDARRWLPLRSRLDARARVSRCEQALRLLRLHPPGPDHLHGETHRRAVGRGRRRLSGRQLSRSCGRSGMASIATTCAPIGRATWASSASLPIGSPAPPIFSRTTAASPTRRSISSPRTTASPSTTRSPTTTSTTRRTARTTRTGTTTTAPGTAARKVRPTTKASTPCAAASSAISSPRCCSRKACR